MSNYETGTEIVKQEVEAELVKEEQAKKEAETSIPDVVKSLNDKVASLEQSLASATAELEKTKGLMAEKEKGFASLTVDRDNIIKAYKDLVIKVNPVIPPEMITGTSIDEINASLEKSIQLVNKIKTSIEGEKKAEEQQVKIPVGTPGRIEPDTSTFSPREKIKFGIEKLLKTKR